MRISSFAMVPLGLLVGLAIVFSHAQIVPLMAGVPSGGIYSALASVAIGLVVGCGLYGLAKRAELFLPALIVIPAIMLTWLVAIPRKLRLLLLFASALAVGLALGRPAFAAETYAIETKPFIDLVMPFLEPVIYAAFMALLGFMAKLLEKYVGVELDEKHRASLAQIATSKLNQLAYEQAAACAPTFYTRHQILDVVAHYIADRGPQAVKHFGLTPKALEAYIAGNFGRDLIKLEQGGYGNPQNISGDRATPPYGRTGPMDPPAQSRPGG